MGIADGVARNGLRAKLDELMKSQGEHTQPGDGLTAEEREFVSILLREVPATEPSSKVGSTWVSRHRREFDLSGQYGDAS